MKNRLYILLICLTGMVLSSSYSAFTQTVQKKVLLEEFTTASCGMCPMRTKLLVDWNDARRDSSIVMAIHEGSGNDAMSNALTDAIFVAMRPDGGWFAPALMIDRGVYPWVDSIPYLSMYNSFGEGGSPGIDTIATRLMRESAKVGVNISGTYNTVTRTIDATVYANFVDAVPSGDWRINLFLVEDSVVGFPGLGPFVGWDQNCYDAGWANANYPGMFNGTAIIGYPHRHVMRNSLVGTWGVQGIIPAVPDLDTVYSASSSLVVDTGFKDNHLSLVAFVSSYGADQDQKFVLNANDVKLAASFSTGIVYNASVSSASQDAIENVFPLPSNGATHLIYTLAKGGKTEITICNMMGQTVEVLMSGDNAAGKHELAFDASRFAKGIYYITLYTDSGKHVRKLIID